MIQNFMRVIFPKLINGMFILGCIGALMGAISAGSVAGQFGGSGSSFMAFLITLLAGLILVVVLFGVIYVLLDIRDALQKKEQPE